MVDERAQPMTEVDAGSGDDQPSDGASTPAPLDERVRDEVVAAHHEMVLAICRRILPDDATAQDAAQTVWLTFLRKWPALRAHANVAGWLHLAARSTALQQRRNGTRRRRRESAVDAAAIIAAPDAGPRLDQRHDLVAVQRAVDELPEVQRSAVLARYCLGLSRAEAAQALGCPEETVHTRTARGMRRLRRRLAGSALATLVALVAAHGAEDGIPGPAPRRWRVGDAKARLPAVGGAIAVLAAVALWTLGRAAAHGPAPHAADSPARTTSPMPAGHAQAGDDLGLSGWSFEHATGQRVTDDGAGHALHGLRIASSEPGIFGRAIYRVPRGPRSADSVVVACDALLATPWRFPRLFGFELANRLAPLPRRSDFPDEVFAQNTPDATWFHVRCVAAPERSAAGDEAWSVTTTIWSHPAAVARVDSEPTLFVITMLDATLLITDPEVSAPATW